MIQFDKSYSRTKIRQCNACCDTLPSSLQDWRIYSPPCWECCWLTSTSLRDPPCPRSYPVSGQCASKKAGPPWCIVRLWRIFRMCHGVWGGLVETAPEHSFILCPKPTSHPSLPFPLLPRCWSREPSRSMPYTPIWVCSSSNPTCSRHSGNSDTFSP